MTGNWHMNGKTLFILWIHQVQQMPVIKNNVNTIASNILSGSETFQGDINMNNNRIRNLYTNSSNNDVINNVVCETTYKKSDYSQLLRVVSRNRWDADGKTIYDLSRAQYDDEAVALEQMKRQQ